MFSLFLTAFFKSDRDRNLKRYTDTVPGPIFSTFIQQILIECL